MSKLGNKSRQVDRLPGEERLAQIRCEALQLRSFTLSDHQRCDLELLLTGACAPVLDFMGRADCESVVFDARLVNGVPFPVPLALTVDAETAGTWQPGERIVLRDDEGAMLALLTVGEIWPYEVGRAREHLEATLGGAPYSVPDGSADGERDLCAVGGTLEGIALPVHHDYPDLRLRPADLRERRVAGGTARMIFVDLGAGVSSACHKAIAAVARELDAGVVVQPAIGAVSPTDLGMHRLIRQQRADLTHYAGIQVQLAVLPLVRRGLGERDLALRALVARNSGATHLVVDPSDYGLADDTTVRDLVARFGVEPILRSDLQIPGEDVVAVRSPAVAWGRRRSDRLPAPGGATCFFTGLSGAGKSTIARALAARVAALGRTVTLLDGDLIRRHLSSELTFSKAHRDLNIRRIGYVASEITRHGGIAICAPIAPYRVTRAAVRSMIESLGDFLEIHVATPLAVCAQRDPKGLYAKAHAGLIKDFTGIDDPYEAPEHPELQIDTSATSVEVAVELVLHELSLRGHFGDRGRDGERVRFG